MNTNTPTVFHASFPIPSTCQFSTEEWQRCDNVLENTRTYIFAYRHQRGAESCQSCEHQPVCLAGWVLPSWKKCPNNNMSCETEVSTLSISLVWGYYILPKKEFTKETSVVCNNSLCIYKWLDLTTFAFRLIKQYAIAKLNKTVFQIKRVHI